MGSPQNYYGVGFYEGLVTHTSVATGHTSCGAAVVGPPRAPGTSRPPRPSGGQWTPSSGTIQASVNSNNNVYATENTNGEKQQFVDLRAARRRVRDPHAGHGTGARRSTGIEVRLTDAFVSATCSNSTIGVDLSWDAGTTWSTAVAHRRTSAPAPRTATTCSAAARRTGAWGAHTWARNDFSDANFRVRLTANKGCGTAGTTLDLDHARGSASSGR